VWRLSDLSDERRSFAVPVATEQQRDLGQDSRYLGCLAILLHSYDRIDGVTGVPLRQRCGRP
jgi:hypothetical protein